VRHPYYEIYLPTFFGEMAIPAILSTELYSYEPPKREGEDWRRHHSISLPTCLYFKHQRLLRLNAPSLAISFYHYPSFHTNTT